ncbi:Beta-mannosidase [Amphibalanus amphitrite]|uniref:beta-mannosidase n=1 Tax=Amphibalanus amphitrite TaxID=1232801 RepID=A0A6A4X2K0_AMPAM|nr:Beta-mannosidase [Amphibalanus amphitrite]
MSPQNALWAALWAVLAASVAGDVTLDLGDTSHSGVWVVRSGDGRTKATAAVPGGVYSDLLHAGVLNQSLYYRFNDVEYRWVAESDWTFSRHFTADAELLDCARVELVCDGIDTVSNVSINGRLVGTTDSQFVRYVFDVKAALREGDNEISVSAASYVVPPECVPPVQNGFCHANHIRKMQASFSWDWGPAFPNAGVWRPLRLVGMQAVALRDVMVRAQPVTAGSVTDTWRVQPSLLLSVAVPASVSYTAAVPGVDAQVSGSFTVEPTSAEVVLEPLVTRALTLDDLWWPNGPIGRPTLQTLTLCLNVTAPVSQTLPCRNVTFGLREVVLVQDPVDDADPDKGLTFYFRVNGVEVFAKGSNWIPADVLTERVTPAYLRSLLTSARDANMNMLRVWGGGIYEDDTFYALADELGLMVWQDVMFACSMYPADAAFLSSVRAEVYTQLWRLQHHPSIVLWAGNNENEQALHQNWYGTAGDFERYKADYVTLYVDTVRDELIRVLGDHDSFVTSSPSNGRRSDEQGYVSDNPGSSLYGDVHVYEYARDMWDERIFPGAAEVSEPADLAYHSDWAGHRQHHAMGNAELLAEIGQHFALPQDVDGAGGFRDIVYLSQVNQALAIRSETEHYRRGRSELDADGRGRTMGAMFWQLNDIWQAPTWAAIEYGGRWRALQYAARRFFAPLLASVYVTGRGDSREVVVYAVSDLPEDIADVSLRVSVHRWDRFDEPQTRLVANLTVSAAAAQRVWSAPLADLLPDTGLQLLRAALVDRSTGAELAQPSELYVEPFQNVRLSVANVRVAAVSAAALDNRLSTDRLLVTVAADAPAPFVWLETPLAGRFSDNGFTQLEAEVQVEFLADEPTDSATLFKSLTVRSLQDAYQQ